MKTTELQFPPRRDTFKGVVAPVWCEPMAGSGERICCGVAAISGSHTLVVNAPGFARVAAAYNPENEVFLLKCAQKVLEGLRAHIAKEKEFPEGDFCLEGFSVGESMQTTGNTMDEMAVAGLMMRSSFTTQKELERLK